MVVPLYWSERLYTMMMMMFVVDATDVPITEEPFNVDDTCVNNNPTDLLVAFPDNTYMHFTT
jgi:hypothetical protein